ncbi:MAG: hypothetical protein HY820_42825 [Acidobacteria bacterium]|nr:hypothetical protein [Acidobacteriota bacterium]
MSVSLWSRPARNLLAAFLAVTMLPGAALLWLGWRWLEQDRIPETQRSEQAADLLVAALQQRLATIETSLTNPAFTPSHDAVVLVLEGRRLQTRPPNRLLYQPFAPPASEPPAHLFAVCK